MKLHFFSAEIWILLIVSLNIYLYLNKESLISYEEVYSIQFCQDVHCIIYSMFLHADAMHLLGNMFGLVLVSYDLFVNTSRKPSYWNYCFPFLLIFFISGIIGSSANIALDSYYRFLWNSKLESYKNKISCSHWLCKNTINLISKPLATAFTYTYHSKEFIAMKLNQFAPRIGASGGVYGLYGARIFTAIFSPDHYRLGLLESLWFIFNIGQEIISIPQSLEGLSKALWHDGDMIDHLCHVASFFTGFVVAACVEVFFRLFYRR